MSVVALLLEKSRRTSAKEGEGIASDVQQKPPSHFESSHPQTSVPPLRAFGRKACRPSHRGPRPRPSNFFSVQMLDSSYPLMLAAITPVTCMLHNPFSRKKKSHARRVRVLCVWSANCPFPSLDRSIFERRRLPCKTHPSPGDNVNSIYRIASRPPSRPLARSLSGMCKPSERIMWQEAKGEWCGVELVYE